MIAATRPNGVWLCPQKSGCWAEPARQAGRNTQQSSQSGPASRAPPVRGDGRQARLLKTIARVDLLILDDWGLSPLPQDQARDLLEIMDDRHGRASTIVTSQLEVEHWHDVIPNPTIAYAILDRLVHNAHRLVLAGECIRKRDDKKQGLDSPPWRRDDPESQIVSTAPTREHRSKGVAGINRYPRPTSSESAACASLAVPQTSNFSETCHRG
jgi:hypothetical protein